MEKKIPDSPEITFAGGGEEERRREGG